MRVRVASILAVGLLLALFVPASSAEDATVSVTNFAFTPSSVSIDVGDSVTWDWASGTHNVIADAGETWCSTRSTGATCVKVFTTAGSFPYHCGIHPSMTGTVNVAGIDPVITITSHADGASVQGTFTLAGTATHPIGVASVQYKIDAGAFQPVDTFPGGASATWSTGIATASIPNGLHTFTIKATGSDGEPAEKALTLSVDNPGVVNLHFTAFQGAVGNFGMTTVTGTVRNTGTVAVTGVEYVLEYFYLDTWRVLQERTLTLSAGGSLSVFFTWESTTKVGAFPVRGVLDPDHSIPETDETDNIATSTASFWTSAVPGIDLAEPV